ncbi:hypothetical protein [Leptolyngbya sp. FACHB-17]|uniref:hypothetical protein n=1 Tax=unclassified Leptolyngbya TaxID=2650499 RepID=UPI0016811E84|nr:hypothetical protein [Leptolyngbya sp. FACHB-17]MBD2079578.1 hypothetical protein [Leptolyngbya sp. FACHB-17]
MPTNTPGSPLDFSDHPWKKSLLISASLILAFISVRVSAGIPVDRFKGSPNRRKRFAYTVEVSPSILPMSTPKSELSRLSEILTVRFPPSDRNLLKSVCRQTSQSEADILRQGFKLYVLKCQMENRLIQSAHQKGISYPIVN